MQNGPDQQATRPIPSFRDGRGRTWYIALTLGNVPQIAQETGVDFRKIDGGKFFMDFAADSHKISAVTWILCEKQAAHYGLSQQEFFEGFDGDAVDDLLAALWEAIVNFTPRALRPAMTKLIAQTNQNQASAMTALSHWVDENGAAMAEDVARKTTTALETYRGPSPS